MRKYALLVYSISIILGCFLGFAYGSIYVFYLLGIVLAAFFIFFIYTNKKDKTSIVYLAFIIILLGIMAGLLRSQDSFKRTSLVAQIAGQNVFVKGVIAEFPDKRESITYYKIETEKINQENLETNLLVRANRFPEFNYGDTLEIKGRLENPKSNFSSQSLFNYAGFLSKDNVYGILYYPEVKKVRTGQGIVKNIFDFKSLLVGKVEQYIVEPYAGLLLGILLGIKQALGESVLESFKNSGLLHIVVLSGYNVALVISAVLSFTKKLSNKTKLGLVTFFVVAFIFFVGAGASVVRAGIMALLAFYARTSGKISNANTFLFLAVAIMSLYEPRSLIYDPGFHLSILATFGIININPIIFTKIKKYIKLNFISEIISTTISAQVMVAPFLLWYMGGISLVGLVSNVLVLPIVPIVMFLGGVLLVLAFISKTLASLISIPLTYLLMLIVKISEVASLHGLSYVSYNINTWAMIFCYLLILFLVTLSFQKKKDLDTLSM